MTPKEKAKELIRQFYSVGAVECKQCALLAVDEILNYDIKAKSEAQFVIQKRIEDYWQDVKQELENL
jgi:hypothetical protein